MKARRHPWTHLDRHAHRLPRPWLVRTDMALVRLARGGAAIRLALGEGLATLRQRALDLDLGFSSTGAYALERLGRRPRWADESRRVAERLAHLPILRAAVRAGELGWSAADLLARHATPENEAALLDAARELTFRALREQLTAEAARSAPDANDAPAETDVAAEDDEHDAPRRETISLTTDFDVAWGLEATRGLVRAITGDPSTDTFVEALLAEGLSTLLARRPSLRVPGELDDRDRALADAWRAEVDAWRKSAERDLEANIPEYTDADLDPDDLAALDDLPPIDLATAPAAALDAHLRALAHALAARDLRLGELALDFVAQDGWRRLGYASEGQYLRERLRISHASFKAHMTLARRAITLPEVAAALDAGVIGFEAACVVSRVAEKRTVQAWLERATQRTVKHLREEVDAAESIARATGTTDRGPDPPDPDTLADFFDLERAMLDGRAARHIANLEPGQMSASPMSADAANDDTSQMSAGQISADAANDDTSQMSASPTSAEPEALRPGAGRATLRLRVHADLARQWQLVAELFRRSALPGPFEVFLLEAFWTTWLKEDPADKVAYHTIYERDRYRCSSPVCTRNDVTPHHVVFRSRGGGEEPENLVSLCVTCHLELLHDGARLSVAPLEGAAPLRWTIGRHGLLEVIGREKRA